MATNKLNPTIVEEGLGAAAIAVTILTSPLLRPWYSKWGASKVEVERRLPGDERVTVPNLESTRAITINASVAQVWPWLVQMGYGRGGWYSYDQMDMDTPSAETILEEYQDLAEGDLVRTHPDGGFVARVVEPGRALVLYLDSELVRGQLEAAADALSAVDVPGEEEPAGLQVAGVMGDLTMPEFRGSWAFVLEPEPDGTTRLVERMRLWAGDAPVPPRLGLPLMGLGVFVMTRKHMLGVKERAERLAAGSATDVEPGA